MKKTGSRLLALTTIGLLAVPGSLRAQGVFGIPWPGGERARLMDESDVAHLSASRSVDFDRIEADANQRCRELLAPKSGGDAHERALRSSDLILAHLRAATLKGFGLEGLTASLRPDMANRFGTMTYGESTIRSSRLALDAMLPPGVPPRAFEPDPEDLPFDCQ